MRVLLVDMGLLRADFHVAPELCGTRFAARIESLLEHLNRSVETRLALCLDSPGESWRRDLLEEYKGNRQQLDEQQRDELDFETDEAVRLLQRVGAAAHECPGYEADDIVATLADQVVLEGGQAVIHSADKDCNQLLAPESVTRLTRAVREQGRLRLTWCTAEHVRQRWGVTPEQWTDFQTLVGDASDNVHGCPWVGPKKAARWLQRYGTLEQVVRHRIALGLKGRNLAAFDAFVPRIDEIRRVVTLVRDVPGVLLRERLPF